MNNVLFYRAIDSSASTHKTITPENLYNICVLCFQILLKDNPVYFPETLPTSIALRQKFCKQLSVCMKVYYN